MELTPTQKPDYFVATFTDQEFDIIFSAALERTKFLARNGEEQFPCDRHVLDRSSTTLVLTKTTAYILSAALEEYSDSTEYAVGDIVTSYQDSFARIVKPMREQQGQSAHDLALDITYEATLFDANKPANDDTSADPADVWLRSLTDS